MAAKKMDMDKEAMFRKIMPSSSPGTTASSEQASRKPETPPTVEPPSSPIIQSGGLQIRKENNQILVNIIEYAVVDRLDAAFNKFKCCKCDKCRRDVAALALNKLTPKYMVVLEKDISSYTALVNSSEISTAIVQAILQVRANPRH